MSGHGCIVVCAGHGGSSASSTGNYSMSIMALDLQSFVLEQGLYTIPFALVSPCSLNCDWHIDSHFPAPQCCTMVRKDATCRAGQSKQLSSQRLSPQTLSSTLEFAHKPACIHIAVRFSESAEFWGREGREVQQLCTMLLTTCRRWLL